ncbi:MAG: DUF2384 domain-containing protein [Rhodocyclaceae bacterium]|nr:DUF2384 domain-containing protein [Rhodocyclaceae bacterium]
MNTLNLDRPPSLTVRLLGGVDALHAQPDETLDWVELVRRGFPAAAIDALVRATRMTQSELSQVLRLPERTLARRKREGQLSAEESDKLLRLARVVERAQTVFTELDAALDWLRSPNASLAGASPLSLLDTDVGAESVLDTLGRIEHGVFA